jgi:hypothetical protein
MRVTAHGPTLDRAGTATFSDLDDEDELAETLELDGRALTNADDVKALINAEAPGGIRSLSLRRCRLTDAATLVAIEVSCSRCFQSVAVVRVKLVLYFPQLRCCIALFF